MKKLTQKERVVNQLLKEGFITRNDCLRNFISRLGAIICDLEAEGWEFEAKYDETRNYVYTVKICPLVKVVYTLPNGENLVTYKNN